MLESTCLLLTFFWFFTHVVEGVVIQHYMERNVPEWMRKTTDKIKPTYVDFDHDNYKWKSDIDYRKNPHLYHIGRGQQGVLTCEPYKSELHPLWRFKTPEEAQLSILGLLISFLVI